VMFLFDNEGYMDYIEGLFLGVLAAIGGLLGSYTKEKGKNVATKEDFSMLQEQLSRNTVVVEGIKAELGEKAWITQQVWVKKQEAYDAIFELLFHVKRYVDHQVIAFEEFEYINKYHPYFQIYDKEHEVHFKQMWEKDKKEYEEWVKDPEGKDVARDLKGKYDVAMLELLKVVELKAIYISPDVSSEIDRLRIELQQTHEYEGWDEHFSRLSSEMDETIIRLRDISRIELKIET
ncbi:hypothetical protein, partial [Aliivibrio fischeri]|uniref:hypothetical protein n=1 Tax=Aliivibrio fischeri TaxID=668 RepID=UPI001BE3E30B